KLTFDFAFGKNPDKQALETLLDGIQNNLVDFSQSNPMWRFYELTPTDIKKYGLSSLEDFLPSMEVGANRDIGKYDPVAKVMRFGAKHNDIFPILGDMIRWKLNLPNRQKVKSEAMAD